MARTGNPLTPSELEQIGGKIRRIREARGMRVKDLAAAATVSDTHLSNIENGRRPAHPATYRRIAEALDVELATLAARYDLEGVA